MFIVNQTQQAIVLQFGEPRQVITEPGLQFKIPFINDVEYFETRVLNLDPQPEEIEGLRIHKIENYLSDILKICKVASEYISSPD